MNDFFDKLCSELERAKADASRRTSEGAADADYLNGYCQGLDKAYSLWAQCVAHDLTRHDR